MNSRVPSSDSFPHLKRTTNGKTQRDNCFAETNKNKPYVEIKLLQKSKEEIFNQILKIIHFIITSQKILLTSRWPCPSN
jgi:hypothetical protein